MRAFPPRQTKINHGKYSSVNAFMADIKTMVDNAWFYNEDGSEIYKDATRIWVTKRHLAYKCVGCGRPCC